MMKNNKIKKITAVAVSVIMAAMMLSACGSGSPSKSADGKTIITVGDWPSKDGIEKDNMEDAKAKFEAANSDIEVKPDSWQFELKSFYAKAADSIQNQLYGSSSDYCLRIFIRFDSSFRKVQTCR